jgi:hypothetical protein
MPERKTTARARQDARKGKAPSTQAGEFVHEAIEHIRKGKHGARSSAQAIAIGLSKARRAGIDLSAPPKGSARKRQSAARDAQKGQATRRAKPSPKRSRATTQALKKEPRTAASKRALSQQAKRAAQSQPKRARSQRAKTAAQTRRRTSA